MKTFLLLILFPLVAIADCQTQSITIDGRTMYCTTCCYPSGCTTTCF